MEISPPEGRKLFFCDGLRRVDYILVYNAAGKDPEKEAAKEKNRTVFERNLVEEGLEIEHDTQEGRELQYVKVHAPWEVLSRYAEIMKLRMPIKECFQKKGLHFLHINARSLLNKKDEVHALAEASNAAVLATDKRRVDELLRNHDFEVKAVSDEKFEENLSPAKSTLEKIQKRRSDMVNMRIKGRKYRGSNSSKVLHTLRGNLAKAGRAGYEGVFLYAKQGAKGHHANWIYTSPETEQCLSVAMPNFMKLFKASIKGFKGAGPVSAEHTSTNVPTEASSVAETQEREAEEYVDTVDSMNEDASQITPQSIIVMEMMPFIQQERRKPKHYDAASGTYF